MAEIEKSIPKKAYFACRKRIIFSSPPTSMEEILQAIDIQKKNYFDLHIS